MPARLQMGKVQPAAYKAMDALDNYISTTAIEKIPQELIRIRASLINGCAYCVNYHSAEALKAGESAHRLLLVGVWREAKNVFTPDEQLLFEMTEELTLIHKNGLSTDVYDRAIAGLAKKKQHRSL